MLMSVPMLLDSKRISSFVALPQADLYRLNWGFSGIMQSRAGEGGRIEGRLADLEAIISGKSADDLFDSALLRMQSVNHPRRLKAIELALTAHQIVLM